MDILNPKSKKDLTELAMGRATLARTGMTTNFQKWRNLLDLYNLGSENNLKRRTDERGKVTNADQNISTVSSSILWNAVEAIAPRMISNFDPEGWFNVVPRPGTKMDSAQFVEDMLQEQLDDTHANEVFPVATKQAVKLGKSVIKVRWDVEYGNVHEREVELDSQGNIAGERFVRKQGLVFDGVKIELVPWYNFYPDPKARCMRESDFVIEESTMDIRELERRAELGLFDGDTVKRLRDNLKKESTGSDPVTSDDYTYHQRDSYRTDVKIKTYTSDNQVIHLGGTYGGRAGEEEILNYKKTDNPYSFINYVDLATNVDEINFFPAGILEAVRDDHAIVSSLMQMSLDAGVMELRPMRALPKNFGADLKKFQAYKPNGIIEYDYDPLVDGNRSFRDFYHEFKPDPNGFLSMLPMLLQMMMGEAQKKTRVTEYLTGGATTGSNKTARGAALLTQNAEIGIGVMTHLLAMGATALLEMMLEMNRMFNYNPMIPQYGKYNFRVFDSATADENMRLQVLMNQFPIIAQLGGNVREVERRILRLARVPGIDAILPRDGSMEKNQEEQLMGQLAQMQLQQGQNGGNNQNF